MLFYDEGTDTAEKMILLYSVLPMERIRCTVVILLKATKGKSQNPISLKQQRILKIDKSEKVLRFLSSLQICLFENYAMKIVVTIGHF